MNDRVMVLRESDLLNDMVSADISALRKDFLTNASNFKVGWQQVADAEVVLYMDGDNVIVIKDRYGVSPRLYRRQTA